MASAPDIPGWRSRLRPGALLRSILAQRGVMTAPLWGTAAADLHLIRETRERVPLLMPDAAALQIILAVRAVHRLDGALAEAGVYRGGSARLICTAKGDKPLHLFDVFDTLQPNSNVVVPRDGHAVRDHFGPVHGALQEVERLLSAYPAVNIHPGLLAGTCKTVSDTEFSFVHLDLDLPDCMRDGLEFFYPRLLQGGILIGDDCHDPDVRTVFASFLAKRDDTWFELPWGQIMIVKCAAGPAQVITST